ncbi:MAG: hypothetical protein QXR27_04005 [Archaeoglobaceae archaeon]
MWLRISSSTDKKEILEIASRLRELGARVEIREWIDWDVDEIRAVKGKLSELKKKGIDLGEWEKRIEIIRELLKKNLSKEDFEYELMKRMFPDLSLEGNVEEIAEKLINAKTMMREVETFLAINGIKFGKNMELPEDPEVFIETWDESAKEIIKVSFYPVTEIYVDVMSVLGADFGKVSSADFEEVVLASVLEIIGEMVAEVEKWGARDLKSLAELSSGVIEGEDWNFVIDCSEIFENIIKSLEKSGIFRVSGNIVRLREK